ncbi:GGDEF domain-containing protein [Lacrimispora sp. 38-1]|uniref:GGDEF domain-containing protein n=1 Tax=Lacrimispora sp. 38-1 TaxID=3125778 RepID=UPI003CE9C75F
MLTGLLNRKQFSKLYLTFLRKNRKRKKILFMFDIDHFKEKNDTYGHMLGNAVLAMVVSEEKEGCYHVTISVGISEVDEALYRSKENGRNQISIYLRSDKNGGTDKNGNKNIGK